MAAISTNDILFDDFLFLSNLIGPNELTFSLRNTDCDCIGYILTSDQDELDTNQIARSTDKAN
ncbi:hypothetical protein [Arcicella lustrica]|uniref:Uncharacterized protein n=1 Tax=Arcicella lustrica TaxID=2984196 RepID=A0ABU5SGI0_9BACT|nr:hypothetical protein [Arcicella sp. DC25W]MEA5426403.1 hypothetical protein [Arcicella sp. DC25W]